jgi:hypothetical protein
MPRWLTTTACRAWGNRARPIRRRTPPPFPAIPGTRRTPERPAAPPFFTSAGTPKSAGRPGPGRNQNQVRRDLRDQLRRKSGAIRDHLGAGLPRVVRQRVDEAIVVIHQQQLRAGAPLFAAILSAAAAWPRPACGRSRWPSAAFRALPSRDRIVEQRRARRISAMPSRR